MRINPAKIHKGCDQSTTVHKICSITLYQLRKNKFVTLDFTKVSHHPLVRGAFYNFFSLMLYCGSAKWSSRTRFVLFDVMLNSF